MARKAANLTLESVRAVYETLSGKASDIIRQLSLAAVGLIWIFKVGTDATARLEPALIQATFFIFLALSLDLLQYLVGTATWHLYFRKKENENVASDEKFEAPRWINWPTWIISWSKAGAMIVAYTWFIVPFLFRRFVG